MTTKTKISGEVAAALTVVAIVVGVPFLLWYWRSVHTPGLHPAGAKIVDLTAISEGGIWTREPVVGYSYWWRTPERVDVLEFEEGDRVVLRLHSPDVQHSFFVPDLNVGPAIIPAGHTVELAFTADRVGEWRFFCVQVCGRDHGRLEGRIIVKPRLVARSRLR